VVSVTSLWADEQVYYPLHVQPGTLWVSPAHHVATGKADPEFRTKLELALELVDAAVQARVPFRAVVADWFYGEDEGLKHGLRARGLGYVLALESHAWWRREGDRGSLREVAEAAEWTDTTSPGEWVRVIRQFRDGHTEDWWTLEITTGPCGGERVERAVVVTTDPTTLPERTTWYLVTNLPAPETAPAHCSSPTTDEVAGRENNQRQPGRSIVTPGAGGIIPSDPALQARCGDGTVSRHQWRRETDRRSRWVVLYVFSGPGS